MKLRKRLTLQFLFWLFILFLTLILFGLFIQRIMILKIEEDKKINDISTTLIETIVTNTQLSQNKVRIKEQALKEAAKKGYWIQILNSEGNEIYNFNRPLDIPRHYAPGEIVYYTNSKNKTGYYVSTYFKKEGKETFTWVCGIKFPVLGKYLFLKSKAQLYLFISIVIASFVLVIFTAWLFGKRLGSPLLHMINWIQNLANGSYFEPFNKQGHAISKKKNGQLKKNFYVYDEVLNALQQLTIKLKKNQEYQQKLEKTREEWMTGVSHDLKTPLSSIIGYADLLTSPKYQWSNEEKVEFTQIIKEKASYMEDLVQDFNLTFRLKNEALPLNKESTDIVEIVRRSVIDAANLPQTQNQDIYFSSSQPTLYRDIDPVWFKRAIDNLIMNSVLHNAEDTVIEVEVNKNNLNNIDNPLEDFYIIIRDNGKGMDELTKERLFDRYYRGTNTSQPYTGTGLGMVIAKQLVQAHNGTIFTKSTLNKGTEFKITLFK
ncbi:sensor histidine kinase [Priestia aryabhattai]